MILVDCVDDTRSDKRRLNGHLSLNLQQALSPEKTWCRSEDRSTGGGGTVVKGGGGGDEGEEMKI